MNFTVISWIS